MPLRIRREVEDRRTWKTLAWTEDICSACGLTVQDIHLLTTRDIICGPKDIYHQY